MTDNDSTNITDIEESEPILGIISTLGEGATVEELDEDYRDGGICTDWIDKESIYIKTYDEFDNEITIILSNEEAIRLKNELGAAIECPDRHNWEIEISKDMN